MPAIARHGKLDGGFTADSVEALQPACGPVGEQRTVSRRKNRRVCPLHPRIWHCGQAKNSGLDPQPDSICEATLDHAATYAKFKCLLDGEDAVLTSSQQGDCAIKSERF
jgi:hypothetical protein